MDSHRAEMIILFTGPTTRVTRSSVTKNVVGVNNVGARKPLRSQTNTEEEEEEKCHMQ